jgi:hypothetical protein
MAGQTLVTMGTRVRCADGAPVSAVSRVDAGIQLNITKRQVRHLPRVNRAFRGGQAP